MHKYDIHCHTYYSACSNNKPGLLLKILKKKGYNGIAVTDHDEIRGALKVKSLNKDKNFEVIIGTEVDTDVGDVLCYYLNSKIKSSNFYEVVDEVRKQDGLIVIPHPFRLSINPKHTFGIPLKKIKNKIDAVECFNARMLPGSNGKAQKAAKKLNITGTGGSDAHFWFEIGTAYTRFNGSFRDALKKKKTEYGGSILVGSTGGFLSFLRKRILRPKPIQ